MTRVAVMGAGNWGTAFAGIMADAGATVRMWSRRQEIADQINEGCNLDYLPDLRLPDTIRATTDPDEACAGADIVVLAVPSQTLRTNLETWGTAMPTGAPVISLMKGVELGTTKRMSEVISEVGRVEQDRIVVVSGPNLAPEIAQHQPAASVVACADMGTAERVATAIATRYFRPYTDTDVVGAEVCGATKNVIALAVGMAEGLGFGDNTKATIITRGLAETTRLGMALGAHQQTFLGLAGVGDLIATCMSPLSRNHTFGVRLGRGMAVEEAAAQLRQTAEGVKSCQSILALGEHHGVELPIVEQVVAVVRDGLPATEVGPKLMARDLKAEKHGTPQPDPR
jgi:glycerol-3-phosphate dehydrogenase (NAD(P)+)